MRGALARVDAWFRAPLPQERLDLARFCIGAYAVIYLISRARHLLAPIDYPPAQFAPVGVISLLDAPLAAAWLYLALAVAVLSGIAFSLRRFSRAADPVFALSLTWLLSYRHSWGMIFHTDNLLVLHVVVLAIASAVTPLPTRNATAPTEISAADAQSGWILRTLCLVTVATYVIAGVAKLSLAGWGWVNGSTLRDQIAYDALRKLELGSVHSPLGTWLLPHAWVFPPLASFSLAAELLAPLALLGRRAAAVWCISAWLFHAGVLALMAIAFPYPLSAVAFAPFAPLERWWPPLRARLPGFRAPSGAA